MFKPMDKKIASFYAKILLYLVLNRGSYTSARVILNLLNELRKKVNGKLAKHCIIFSQQV